MSSFSLAHMQPFPNVFLLFKKIFFIVHLKTFTKLPYWMLSPVQFLRENSTNIVKRFARSPTNQNQTYEKLEEEKNQN